MADPVSNPTPQSQTVQPGNKQSTVPAPTDGKAPTPAEKRYLKAKVDGVEEQVDEETLLRHYQKERTADKKLREVAQQRKEIETFYETLMNNPEEILNDPRIPLKKRELAERWLMEQLGEELQEPEDPRDKKARELEQELKKYKDKEQAELTKKEQAEYQALVNQRKEQIAKTLTDAMKLSPLSKDPEVAAETLKEMVAYMRMTKQAGYEASPEEIAKHVEQRHMQKFAALVGRLEGDDLLALADRIGLTAKVRKADLARIQRSRQVEQPEVANDWQPSSGGKKREVVDPDQLRRPKR